MSTGIDQCTLYVHVHIYHSTVLSWHAYNIITIVPLIHPCMHFIIIILYYNASTSTITLAIGPNGS